MIHLKYKCKVPFMKLPLIRIYLCLSWFSKMPPQAATQAAARLWTARAGGENNADNAKDKPPHASWFCETWFTRGRVRELKNAHNSVTVQNRTHVYMNFFWSQRPRKSPPAVMSSSRESPCIILFPLLPPDVSSRLTRRESSKQRKVELFVGEKLDR
jgi:hypothetical protein